MTGTSQIQTHQSIRRHLAIVLGLIFLLVCGIGGLATTTELSGAVISSGQLVVDSEVKKVQHPHGGIVGQLLVSNGTRVKAGNVVIRLDETQTRANFEIVRKNLDELAARRARNVAERDGSETISFPEALLSRADDPDVKRIIEEESKLFEIRRLGRDGQKAQFRERIVQYNEEIRGHSAQEAAKLKEIEFIKVELQGVKELYRRNLVPITRLTALERDAARLEGERAQLIASIAQARGKVAEIELQILQVDQDLRTEVGKELADIRAKTAEALEKKVAAEDQLKRVELRAPQDGIVHQLSVHTVGGVIKEGEPIMLIVPAHDSLAVEVKVQPQDIDQLHLGQTAILRFTAFNQRVTPELNGEVSRISADISKDEKSGQNFYTVRVQVPDDELTRLDKVKLVPGMPVEAFIQTTPRTMMSYLMRPMADQLRRSFRDK
jgi:HlyD family secretion protein